MQHLLPVHGTMPEPATRPPLAIAAKGFRPFFLLAGVFAALIVPIWLLIVDGVLAPSAYLDPSSWHAHEMIFGYTAAVIAGFLLTAVGTWTQRETAVGAPLLADSRRSLLLRALPAVGVPVWSSIATHALTVGAIAALTLGMMVRVALGHTGRPLVASPAMNWAFAAITAAAIARVGVPLFAMRWHFVAVLVAGALWTLAFVIYLVKYAPVLVSPRVDGKAG